MRPTKSAGLRGAASLLAYNSARGAADVKNLFGEQIPYPYNLIVVGGNIHNPFANSRGGPDRHCAFRGARP